MTEWFVGLLVRLIMACGFSHTPGTVCPLCRSRRRLGRQRTSSGGDKSAAESAASASLPGPDTGSIGQASSPMSGENTDYGRGLAL